jgi:hypothetical protein
MAGISILQEPSILRPVYGINRFVVYDSSNANDPNSYYEVKIYSERGDRAIRQLPDENRSCDIDLQGILQGFFQSEVITHDQFLYNASQNILEYNIEFYGYGNVADVSISAGPYYVINATERETVLKPADLLFGMSLTPWLTRYNQVNYVQQADKLYLQGLYGDYGALRSDFTGYYFRWTRNNGQQGKLGIYLDPSTIESIIDNPGVFSVNLSPDIQNNVFGGSALAWRRGPKNFSATRPYPTWSFTYSNGTFELNAIGAADSSLVIYDISTGAGYYTVSFDGSSGSYLLTQPIGMVDTSSLVSFRPYKSNSVTLAYTVIDYSTGSAISSTIYSDASGNSAFSIPLNSSFTGALAVRIDCSSAQTFDLLIPSIVSININPALTDLQSYTIYSWDGSWQPVVYQYQAADCRFDRKYRLAYVNSLGGTDFYNFTMANLNTINITKTIFRNTSGWQVYGTEVQDKYTINTDWMNEQTSLALKDLWHAPKSAIMYEGSTGYRQVVYQVNQQDILRHRNQKMIAYELQFTYSDDYTVQKN